MPIKIMCWNVENFSIGKHTNNKWDHGQLRWAHITSTIAAVNPDIFVLIEVGSGGAAAGAVTTGTSQQGVTQLLANIQPAAPAPAAYSVVPPIVSGTGGKREAIAVFFKHASLTFQGPFVWTGAASSPPVLRTGPVTAVAYGGAWAGALPAAGGQNTRAGKWQFSNTPTAVNPRNAATNLFPRADTRSLYLTSFLDTTVVPNRTIDVFAIHAPPQADLAGDAVASMAEVRDIATPPGANGVKVIVGDFNINVIDPEQAALFNPLSQTFITPGKRRRGLSYQTHNVGTPTVLKGVGGQARLLNRTYAQAARIAAKKADPALAPPAYDYVGTERFNGGTALALDNILTLHGGAAGAPANFFVVNRVYQVVGNPYAPDLGAGTTIPGILAIYNIGAPTADAGSANSYFRNYQRFGKIGASRGASDHMALVIDV